MKKLKQLHLDAIEDNNVKCTDLTCSMTGSTETYALKSAQITRRIAIDFAIWCDDRESTESYKTWGMLFQEFLKQKQ